MLCRTSSLWLVNSKPILSAICDNSTVNSSLLNSCIWPFSVSTRCSCWSRLFHEICRHQHQLFAPGQHVQRLQVFGISLQMKSLGQFYARADKAFPRQDDHRLIQCLAIASRWLSRKPASIHFCSITLSIAGSFMPNTN